MIRIFFFFNILLSRIARTRCGYRQGFKPWDKSRVLASILVMFENMGRRQAHGLLDCRTHSSLDRRLYVVMRRLCEEWPRVLHVPPAEDAHTASTETLSRKRSLWHRRGRAPRTRPFLIALTSVLWMRRRRNHDHTWCISGSVCARRG